MTYKQAADEFFEICDIELARPKNAREQTDERLDYFEDHIRFLAEKAIMYGNDAEVDEETRERHAVFVNWFYSGVN